MLKKVNISGNLYKKAVYLFFILLFPVSYMAQGVLPLEEALKIGLEKNLEVLVAKNEKEILKKQNNFGNAGMSPQLSLNAGYTFSNLNSHQEFSTGAVQDRTGAIANNLNASLNANWMVFDGMKMFAVKKRLQLNEVMGELQLRQLMEQKAYEIIMAYNEIVRIKSLIKAANLSLQIYTELKKIAEVKMETGKESKVDYLMAKTNENNARSKSLQLEVDLLKAKSALNSLMEKPVDTAFETSDSITITYKPSTEELKSSAQGNTEINISKQNELISEQYIKESKSANLPFLQLNTAYNFTRNQSEAGFVFLNRQLGFNAGLSAGWLLFNGTKNKKLTEERQVKLLNDKYTSGIIQKKIDGLVYLNYKIFLTQQQILEMEKQNISDANELLNVSLERYRLGKATLLETMQAQQNVEASQLNFSNALYETKKAETELMKANGVLIK